MRAPLLRAPGKNPAPGSVGVSETFSVEAGCRHSKKRGTQMAGVNSHQMPDAST